MMRSAVKPNALPSATKEGVVVVPIIELERPRPDSSGVSPFREKVLFGLAFAVVAGLLAVPFEAVSQVAPRSVWGPLFLLWGYAAFKLFDYVSHPFVRKRELHLTPECAVVVSSDAGEQKSVVYRDVNEVIVFDDEWYNGSRTLHWRGVILERKGELPVQLELGEHTDHVASLLGDRVNAVIQRERKVWPRAPEFD